MSAEHNYKSNMSEEEVIKAMGMYGRKFVIFEDPREGVVISIHPIYQHKDIARIAQDNRDPEQTGARGAMCHGIFGNLQYQEGTEATTILGASEVAFVERLRHGIHLITS